MSQTLMALADPTRRAILQRLSKGEACVTELAQPFAMSLNAVSKHIVVLERARLVRRRRAGREHLLSFNPEPLDEAATWIERQRAFWTARLDALDAAPRAEDRAAANTSKRRGHLDERQTERRRRTNKNNQRVSTAFSPSPARSASSACCQARSNESGLTSQSRKSGKWLASREKPLLDRMDRKSKLEQLKNSL